MTASDSHLLSILSDQPADHDQLNFDPYAKTLADIIADPGTDTPLTIGVFGTWGRGKTSLMRMVQRRLEAQTRRGQNEASRGHGVSRGRQAWGQVHQMLRGGGWNNNANNVRAANRNNDNPDNRNDNIGFRCVGGALPGAFLAGQVRRLYGHGARATGENSRPVPGWASR